MQTGSSRKRHLRVAEVLVQHQAVDKLGVLQLASDFAIHLVGFTFLP